MTVYTVSWKCAILPAAPQACTGRCTLCFNTPSPFTLWSTNPLLSVGVIIPLSHSLVASGIIVDQIESGCRQGAERNSPHDVHSFITNCTSAFSCISFCYSADESQRILSTSSFNPGWSNNSSNHICDERRGIRKAKVAQRAEICGGAGKDLELTCYQMSLDITMCVATVSGTWPWLALSSLWVSRSGHPVSHQRLM